jgi:hypothetical protein
MTQIVIGNDFELGVTLTKNKQPFEIPFWVIIQATVVSADHNSRYFDPVNVSPATPGTDYSQSLIIVKFSGANTALITKQGPAKIEIEILEPTDPVSTRHPSWFVDVRVVKGQIN